MLALNTALALAEAGHDIALTQSLVARLDLFNEAMVLTTFKEGRSTSCYEVDPADVAAALSGAPIASGHLPAGCLFYQRSGGVETIAVFLPPQRRTLTAIVAGKVKVFADVPCPPLVWLGKGPQYWVWAVTATEWPKPNELLYHPPFPNVYGTGKVCLGSVQFPTCSAATIHQAAQLFFESEFNTSLVDNRSRKCPKDVMAAWKLFGGGEVWPTSDLMAAPTSLDKLREV